MPVGYRPAAQQACLHERSARFDHFCRGYPDVAHGELGTV
jgi:hypothetical protein